MSKPIEEILATKPTARPRIYAYSINDTPHKGLLKVGQTTRDVKQRVAEQVKTAAIKNYRIELDEPAERERCEHGMIAQVRREHVVSIRIGAVRQIDHDCDDHCSHVKRRHCSHQPRRDQLQFRPESQTLCFPPQADQPHPFVPRASDLSLCIHRSPLCR
jgi:hypothetical protein